MSLIICIQWLHIDFFFYIFIYLFIYLFILAVPGLSCGTRDLCCGMRDHLVVAHRLLSCGTRTSS